MPEYPIYLLPQPNFTLIEDLNPEEILCRWSKYPLKDESGRLSALAVEEKRIPTYSTNKVPPSKEDDIKIAFHDNNLQSIKWKEGEDHIAISPDDFYLDEERKCFFIKLGEIHGYNGKYPFPSFSEDVSKYKLEFSVRVTHDPLKVNYSHCCFEIQYLDENGNATRPPSQKSLDKVIIASIRNELIRISKFSIEDFFIN